MKLDARSRKALVKLLNDCAWHFIHERVASGEDSHPMSKECSRLQDRCNKWIKKLEKPVESRAKPKRCAYWWVKRRDGPMGQCKKFTGHRSGFCAPHRTAIPSV